MKLIPLTQGRLAEVDDEEYDALSKFKWYFMQVGYAARTDRSTKKLVYMHREIVGAENGRQVDHISGDKLDNRRSNLRIATNQENHFNMGLRRDNTSGAKGVCWHKKARKWMARVHINGKDIHLGLFADKNEAITVRRSAAQKYQGEFFHA
jgi:hypothetical protein